MNRKVISLSILFYIFIGTYTSFGQFKFGMTDMSVSLTNSTWGLPFIQITPMHPGLEFGATFLENNKEKSSHSVSGNVGYFYHNVMANAPYLNIEYRYEIQIKKTVGIDLAGGVGYLHAFFPGEGYKFNESSDQYESGVVNKAFWTARIGIGLSLLTLKGVEPFIRYDQMMLNNIYNQVSMLRLGARIHF